MASLVADAASDLLIVRRVASESEIKRRLEMQGESRERLKLQCSRSVAPNRAAAASTPGSARTEGGDEGAVQEAFRHAFAASVGRD